MQLITQHERDEQYRQLLANLSPEVARLLAPQMRAKCGARTRGGSPCRATVCARPDGNGAAKRCRLHGGRSTGPTTQAGREAIAESNRRRRKHRLDDDGAGIG
jgi:hypothetical protein